MTAFIGLTYYAYMAARATELITIAARDIQEGDRYGLYGWVVARVTRAPHVVCAISTDQRFSVTLVPGRKIAVRR